MRDGEGRAQLDGAGIVVHAIAGHGVLGAVEDGERGRVGGGGRKVPVREGTLVAARFSQVGLIQPQEVPMPGEEEGVKVDVLRPVDVDGRVVHVLIHRGRVFGIVKLGWLVHEAFDGVGVGFAVGWGHAVEIDTSSDRLGVAWLTPVGPLGIRVAGIMRAEWSGRHQRGGD